jgi:hypothetical protein
MEDNELEVDHDLIGVSDSGFGYQAFCSCGWRTSPKDSSWDASVVWLNLHMARPRRLQRAGS